MKILYITTIGTTMNFFKQLIKELIEEGHTIDIATNTDIADVSDFYKKLGCKIFKISCIRTPFSINNFYAINEIKKIVNNNNYDIVHCHTPVASICTRIACKKNRKKGLKVFYTAHGFHFYKGAPLVNWLVFYPIEKICSYFTDVLITINKEDYDFSKRKMKASKIVFVRGVGIDIDYFKNTIIDTYKKRIEIGIPKDAYMILSVGELSKRKNHIIVIKALKELKNKNIHYVIAGDGSLKDKLTIYIKNNHLENNVHLLGQRFDVNELYKCADLFVFPSLQEGLPVALIEALASELPSISSCIRGAVDILNNEYLFHNKNELIDKINKDINLDNMKNKIDIYSYVLINKIMKELYYSEYKNDI